MYIYVCVQAQIDSSRWNPILIFFWFALKTIFLQTLAEVFVKVSDEMFKGASFEYSVFGGRFFF